MITRNRQAILVIVAALALFAVYRDPQGSGGAVHDALTLVADVVHGLFEFAGAVTG